MRKKESLLSKYRAVLIEERLCTIDITRVHVWIHKDCPKLIKLGLALCNEYDEEVLNTISLPEDFLYVGYFRLPYDTRKLVYFIDEAATFEYSYLYIPTHNNRVLGDAK